VDTTLAIDSSCNGNFGTIYGATWTTWGAYDGGLAFDGIDDYVIVRDGDSLTPTGEAVTVEAWIKPASIPSPGLAMAVGKWNDGSREYEIMLFDGKVRFYAYDGSKYYHTESTKTLSVDALYHVVGVWDGSYLRVYINGLPDGTPTAFSPSAIANTPAFLTIGAQFWSNAWWRFFDGMIDEVHVWDAALSADDVMASFRSKYKDLPIAGNVIFTSAFEVPSSVPSTVTIRIWAPACTSIAEIVFRRITPRGEHTLDNIVQDATTITIDVSSTGKTMHLWLYLAKDGVPTGEHVGVNVQFR